MIEKGLKGRIYCALAFLLPYVILALLNSCNKKENAPGCLSTYTTDIKPIFETKCAITGCHVAGTSLPDFRDFNVLKSRADSGRIEKYVFELQIMPPANAAPLSAAEQEKLKCWLDNGAQNN